MNQKMNLYNIVKEELSPRATEITLLAGIVTAGLGSLTGCETTRAAESDPRLAATASITRQGYAKFIDYSLKNLDGSDIRMDDFYTDEGTKEVVIVTKDDQAVNPSSLCGVYRVERSLPYGLGDKFLDDELGFVTRYGNRFRMKFKDSVADELEKFFSHAASANAEKCGHVAGYESMVLRTKGDPKAKLKYSRWAKELKDKYGNISIRRAQEYAKR